MQFTTGLLAATLALIPLAAAENLHLMLFSDTGCKDFVKNITMGGLTCATPGKFYSTIFASSDNGLYDDGTTVINGKATIYNKNYCAGAGFDHYNLDLTKDNLDSCHEMVFGDKHKSDSAEAIYWGY